MVGYAIYTTEDFDKDVMKLSSEEQGRIQKVFLHLKDNPYVGDQLRYKCLREKRLREKRIYYLVYDDLMAVLIVAVGGKKAQQETIDYIINSFDYYRIYLEQLIKS